MCKVVRDAVAADLVKKLLHKVRIQYGGSVKPENVAEYMLSRRWRKARWWCITEAESFLAFDFVKYSLHKVGEFISFDE